jgi:hypothetical protein
MQPAKKSLVAVGFASSLLFATAAAEAADPNGPGPTASVNGPSTNKTESEPAKPTTNPWQRAGVAKDAAARPIRNNDTETRGGPEIGARFAYALPLGDAAKNASLSDTVSGALPILVDVGYRIVPQLYVGLYGQFAFAFLSDKACPANASCSANDLRFGLNVHYHFTTPAEPYDFWIGAGAGYEILSYKATVAGISAEGSASGFELGNAQVGFDYKMEQGVRVGPFAGVSVGQYSTAKAGNQSGDIKDKALHEWLAFGVRAAYDF